MGKNKVCIITTVHPPFDTRIFHKQAKTLVEAGYDVTLIAQHDKSETVDGIDIIPLPEPENRFSRIFGLSWRAFWLARRQKADIYHFHDPELIPIGVLLKLFNGSKVIYDVHEDVSKQILTKSWVPGSLRKPLARIYSFTETISSRIFDGIVVATESIAENFNRDEAVVVHNYPRLEMLPKFPENGNKKDEVVTTLIYVGGITKNRGIKEAISALSFIDKHKSIKFNLVGKFPDSNFKEEIQALPEYEHVQLVGWLPWEEAWGKAQRASIGIVTFLPMPNHVNALPNKMFEYMAAGLPVIASDFPLWREIVAGNNCGLMVNPEDSRDIAKAIEYIISHPDEAKEMGHNGRKAVEEKYHWNQEGEKLKNLYDKLGD